MKDWQFLLGVIVVLAALGAGAGIYDMVSGYRAQKRQRERWAKDQ